MKDAQDELTAKHPVVFVDTETTGLDPETERIFDLGIIEADGTEYEFHLQPEPEIVKAMHPKAVEVNRFHERTASPKWHWHPDQRALLDGTVRNLLEGRHIVGAVPDFDTRHLTATYKRWALPVPRWHYHLIDVEALAAGYLVGTFTAIQEVGKNPEADGPTVEEAMRAIPPWDSEALSLAIGVDPEEFDRHTALADARWAKAIYEVVLA